MTIELFIPLFLAWIIIGIAVSIWGSRPFYAETFDGNHHGLEQLCCLIYSTIWLVGIGMTYYIGTGFLITAAIKTINGAW